jgi:uncharacterized protein
MKLRVTNPTRGMVLAQAADIANSAAARSRGLLGRSALAVGEGLWILPCDSIHTHGMRFPIDVVFLGRENQVLDFLGVVLPGGNVNRAGAHSVLELPAGTIDETGTQVGDYLTLERVASSDLQVNPEDEGIVPGCFGVLNLAEQYNLVKPGTSTTISQLFNHARKVREAWQGVRV